MPRRQQPPTTATRLAACAAIAASAFATGCTSERNTRLTLADSVEISTLQPSPPQEFPPHFEPVEPSVVSIDRANWQRTEFLVPVDGIIHTPFHANHFRWADQLPRQREEYPTPESALDRTHPRAEMRQIVEGIFAPAVAASDIILFLPRTFARPYNLRISPKEIYERTPPRRVRDAPYPAQPAPQTPPEPADNQPA